MWKTWLLNLVVICSISSVAGLRCHVCDFEEGQFGRPGDCENAPSTSNLRMVPAHPPNHGNPVMPFVPSNVPNNMKFSARYIPPQRGSQVGGGNVIWFPYCVTITGNRSGRKIVIRDVAWADTPQNDGMCENQLPQNYENMAMENPKACYCNRDDGCNNETTSELSDLFCYDCFWYEAESPGSSKECRVQPSESQLRQVPLNPTMNFTTSYELSKMLDPKNLNLYGSLRKGSSDLGRTGGRQQVWYPYCAVLVAKLAEKRIILRTAHWWEDNNKNGICEDGFPSNLPLRNVAGFDMQSYTDVRMCYCNDRKGCNDLYDGGARSVTAGVVLLLLSFVFLVIN